MTDKFDIEVNDCSQNVGKDMLAIAVARARAFRPLLVGPTVLQMAAAGFGSVLSDA